MLVSFCGMPVDPTETVRTEICDLGNADCFNEGIYCCKRECNPTDSCNKVYRKKIGEHLTLTSAEMTAGLQQA